MDVVVSKYWLWLQVARQRPLVSTGRDLLQLVHWLKDPPEHVAQSGWHVTQAPEELNVLDGQELTHCPLDASILFAHVKQKLALPAHVLQDEEHAVQVRLSVGERKVPVGQLCTHCP